MKASQRHSTEARMIDESLETNRKYLATLLAPVMFWGTIVFLILLAALMVLVVDVPRVDATSSHGEASLDDERAMETVYPWDDEVLAATHWLEFVLCLIWPFFIIESAYVLWIGRYCSNPSYWRWLWLAIWICPPLRLCPPHPLRNGKRWLPWYGWTSSSYRFYRRVEKSFSVPMILVALLILPVLIVEWTMHEKISSMVWLRCLLHFATGFIWLAFAIEFILMMQLATRKLEHFKKHWIDLIIILLPLVSFLRSLRAIKAMKIAKFTKLQQLSRMLRIYRLRGLSTKAFRAILLLDVLQRFIGRDPVRRLEKLRVQAAYKQEELREIQEEIESVERQIAARQQLAGKSVVSDPGL